MTAPAPIVLLVEDNEDDVFLLRRALKDAALDVRLQVASDGEEAVAYLMGTGAYGDRLQYPLPELVLLDLKLPYMHGFEVLERIRGSMLRGLRVVVLTSSLHERDRERAAKLGADGFLVKPPTGEMMRKVLNGASRQGLVGDAGFEPATPAV